MKCVIAYDIGGTNVKYGVVTVEGELLVDREFSTESKLGGEELKNKLISITEELKKLPELLKKGYEICGIGIGIPGIVSKEQEIIMVPNIKGLDNFPLKKIIEEKFGCPVFLGNDVNLMAMGEKWKGAGKNRENFICITLGTGVGGAIVRNGEVDIGATGSAGEFGHMVIDFKANNKCGCGQKGCWELYASVPRGLEDIVIKEYGSAEYRGNKIDGKLILNQAAAIEKAKVNKEILKGDLRFNEVVEKALKRYIYAVSAGLRNLIVINNPETIIIGGGPSAQGKWLMEKIQKEVNKNVPGPFKGTFEIVAAELGNRAGIFGAAYEVIRNYLKK